MRQYVADNHERYVTRKKLFQSFGYDIEKERDFILDSAQPIAGDILEIGTGKGYFAVALAQRGYQFTTVDISAEEQVFAKMNIEYLGLQDRVHFIIADAHKLHFTDESFDTCFSINVIHHLDRPLDAVDEMLRVTRRGGKIILSDFSKEGFSVVGKVHQSEGRHHSSGTHTLDEIVAHVEKKGIFVEKLHSPLQDIAIFPKEKRS